MKPSESLPLGVVLERREIDNPWQDHVWAPVAVIPGAPETEDWRELRRGDGWVQYHAATLDIELHRKETDGYRQNLSQRPPMVYIVLRPGEEEGEHAVEPFHVTVCPYEALDYEDSGEEIVEGVPMPDDIVAWVRDFVDEHHVEVPFKKRQRKPYDPRKGGFARRGGGGEGGHG